MLFVTNIAKSFGAQSVLEGVSFVLNRGERIALIGPNGAGKSTLLRCITGDETADRGSVAVVPGTRVGWLRQDAGWPAGVTVAQALAGAGGGYGAARRELDAASATLAAGGDEAGSAYAEASARFDALGGYGREDRAVAIADALGLSGVPPEQPVASLSGGERTRLGLACLLLDEPDLLLLDEPTNHLDIEALGWLEAFVRDYPGAVLVVSHDREFLDRTVQSVLYLDPATRGLREYHGNYSAFVAQRAHERAIHERTWATQQEYVGRVQQDIARLKGGALEIERATTPREPGIRKFAKRKAKLAKARERKLERFLESDGHVEKPATAWSVKLDFGRPLEMGREVFRVRDLRFAYPGRPALIESMALDIRAGDRTAIVGPNGAGKTTLLRLLAGELQPSSGELWRSPAARAGILTQDQETVDPTSTVLHVALRERPMSEGEARTFLHQFLFAGDDVFRPVGFCSPGERARLQLARLVLRGCNVLLLDEPLNHLDVDGREHFERAIGAFAGTVIAVAHDRRFLRQFARQVIEVGGGLVSRFEGGYGAYEERRASDQRTIGSRLVNS